MSEIIRKRKNQIQRAARTRSSIRGTSGRPRLSVHVSIKNVSAQIIDDEKMISLVQVTSVGVKGTNTMTQKASIVGAEIAKKALSSKIKRVVFDRGSKKYHGRVKALAEAARENGLEF